MNMLKVAFINSTLDLSTSLYTHCHRRNWIYGTFIYLFNFVYVFICVTLFNGGTLWLQAERSRVQFPMVSF